MTDFYTREATIFDDFVPDQYVITKRRYLKHVSGTDYKEPHPHPLPFSIEWYPLCNSYYPYTEDVDAEARVNHVLGVTPSFASIRSTNLEIEETFDPYSEKETQLKYLNSNPASFIILSKPGLEGKELGRLLSEYWNCVFIHPEELIREEIESGSRAGNCIEFNLRCGRACGVDVILKLVEKRVRSKSAQHRGFVITGFPLVPNVLYSEDLVSSESAIFTVQDIFDEVVETTINIGVAPEPKVSEVELSGEGSKTTAGSKSEDTVKLPPGKDGGFPLDLGSTSANVCVCPDIENDFEEQLNFVFGLLQDPSAIVYIACETSDVVSWRRNNRFDPHSETTTNLLNAGNEKTVYTMYSRDQDVSNEFPEDLLDVVKYNRVVPEIEKLTHLVTLPIDFPINVMAQLERYHYSALPVIERFVLNHDPQHFLKVDGRLSPPRMFSALKYKLNTLGFPMVVLPKKLTDSDEGFGGEEPALPDFDPDTHSLEECFEYFRTKQTSSPEFKWTLSDWGFKCPVAMKEGSYKDGGANFAVRFMNKVFFLSDEEAWIKFYRNPRPYLLPPFPKSRCRIFVVGPPRSGKTTVATCLKYLLNGEVLDFYQIMVRFKQKKIEELLSKVRSEAISEGIRLLDEERRRQWEGDEERRLEQVERWIGKKMEVLEECLDLLAVYSRSDIRRMSSFPIQLSYLEAQHDFPVKSYLEIQQEIKDTLASNELPTDLALCSVLVNNSEELLAYLPEELKETPKPKPATPFDGPVKEYAERMVSELTLDHDFELSAEETAEMVAGAISEIERRNLEGGGWIFDNLPLEPELIERLIPDYLPDDVFVLQDGRDHQFLIDQFKSETNPQAFDFRTFFTNLSKPDAAWRAPSTKTQVLSDSVFESVDDYELSVNRFSDIWRPISVLLAEFDVQITKINVENKSTSELLEEIVTVVENRHRQLARRLTEEERLLELDDLVATGEDAEEREDSRRFGDTLDYCPIAFHQHGVLWKGKSEFAVKFQDRLYFLCSEEACDMFLQNPYRFLLLDREPTRFPPLRICITGPAGSGKSTLAQALSRNLGVFCFNFEEQINNHPNSALGWGEAETVRGYVESSTDLPHPILERITKDLWFEEPPNRVGFVLEGFPRLESDVTFMATKFAVPDIVLQLSVNELEVSSRLLEKFVRDWEVTKRRKKEVAIRKHLAWEEQRSVRFRELVSAKREERYAEKFASRTLDDLQEVDEIGSEISYDSVADEADLQAINNQLDSELPEPVVDTDDELVEQAIEDYQTRIAESYSRETENLNLAKEVCEFHRIPWITIDGGANPANVLAQSMLTLKPRTNSLFEKALDVAPELVDKLLQSGYCFLSRFGKTCPVQIYEAWNPIQMYVPQVESSGLFPLIHRHYIYFLVSPTNRAKFMTDPLKYVRQPTSNFPLIPFKLAIIGPPKSGKTVLAERFRKTLGLKRITRGMAARYVLTYLPTSQLAKDMEQVLRKGWELTAEMVVKSAQAVVFDGRCSTQGFVLDGFPSSIDETRHLAAVGLVPHLVIDLQATPELIHEFGISDSGKKNRPAFSEKFIDFRYGQWLETSDEFREWLDKEYQVLAKLVVNPSKWYVWTKAQHLALAVCSQIKHYHSYAHREVPLRLSNMQVTPFEFTGRQSSYENYCPCCLHFSYQLVNGGEPPDRTGLVQYKTKFYWLCHEHIEMFVDDPEQYLPPYNNHVMPTNIPKRVRLPLQQEECYENGNCVICYWNNLPRRVVREGSTAYIVGYRENMYVFDKLACMNKFMREPHHYYNKTINFKGTKYPPLRYRELPLLGMLEQYASRLLCQAVSNTATLRPVIAGLTESTSAAINIALFLKVNNPYLPTDFKPFYEEAQQKYQEKRLRLLEYLDQMKREINPYLYYEEPLPKLGDQAINPTVFDVKMGSERVMGQSSSRATNFSLDERLYPNHGYDDT